MPQDTATTFIATSTDETGNVSTDNNSVIITEDPDVGADKTLPTVVVQSPAKGSTLGDNDEISISFSEPMNLESLNTSTILLCEDYAEGDCNDDVDIIWGATEDGNTKAILIGLAGQGILLNYETTYYLIATTGVKDLAGNSLGGGYSESFWVGEAPEEPDAGLTIDPMLTHTGTTGGEWAEDGNAGDAYEWVFGITMPNDESYIALQFADWTNGLATANNMRYWSEEVEDGELGSASNPIVITAANTYPDRILIAEKEENYWINDGQPGIQTNIHVQLQIPSSTPAGSHSTSFKVITEASEEK